ncbi:MAG: hypothetical protein AAFY42_05210, partial [Pseudomonadota bacterium]
DVHPRQRPRGGWGCGRHQICVGAHQCLGLHLARLQIRVLFEALLDRLDAVEPAGEGKRANTTFVGGLKTLPLRVTPA